MDVTSGRGGQSGGIAHFFPTPSGNTGLRVRVRPGRRQIISRQLASALAVRLRLAKAARALTFRSFAPPADSPVDHVAVFQGHTRFATSSMPSVGESHPHQWSPEKRVSMWRVDPATGAAASRSENFSVFVTHNGDFDYLNVYGRDRTQREIGEWLKVVLHSPCPARCDSVKVAGVIELFRTQGARTQPATHTPPEPAPKPRPEGLSAYSLHLPRRRVGACIPLRVPHHPRDPLRRHFVGRRDRRRRGGARGAPGRRPPPRVHDGGEDAGAGWHRGAVLRSVRR